MKQYPITSKTQLTAKKARYRLDFAGHMAQCEENFLRLQRLLPLADGSDQWRFGVDVPGEQLASVELAVIERGKFTTTVSITQLGHVTWLGAHQLIVRIYYDAAVAEVIACRKGRQLREYYTYPNRNMFYENEKVQLNQYLGEWLSHCMRHGHSLSEIVLA